MAIDFHKASPGLPQSVLVNMMNELEIFPLEGCYGFSFGEIFLKDSLMQHEKKKMAFQLLRQ